MLRIFAYSCPLYTFLLTPQITSSYIVYSLIQFHSYSLYFSLLTSVSELKVI